MRHRALTIAMLAIHSSPVGVLGTRDTGGMSVYVRGLAREMGRRGHRVDLFTRRRSTDDPPVIDLDPHVRLVHIDIAPDRAVDKTDLVDYAAEACRAVDRFRRGQVRGYDLIHSHYWVSGQVGRMLRRRWQCPHVITFHTLGAMKTDPTGRSTEPARRLTIEQALVHGGDALLVPCAGEGTNLVRRYGADSSRIAIVPGGVDRQRFRPLPAAAARQRLGLPPQGRLMLSVGRLTPLKGQARIIAALARLGEDDDARLLLVGGDGPEDPEQSRLETAAREAGVAARVHFTGSVPQAMLPLYYAAADVYLMASSYESFGLVALEALACGRPVVASPVGVLPELVRRHCPGVVLTDGSAEGLAAGILAARDQAGWWTPQRIHDGVRAHSWPRAAAAALAAYRNVAR